jgi:hypothetical protein
MKIYPIITSLILSQTFNRKFSVKCCEMNCYPINKIHWKNKIDILEKQLIVIQNQRQSYYIWGFASILIFFPNSFYCMYEYDLLSTKEEKIKKALLTLKTTDDDVDIKKLI